MLPPPNPLLRPPQASLAGSSSGAGSSGYRIGQDDGLPRFEHRYDAGPAVPPRGHEDVRAVWTDPIEFQHGLFAGKVMRFNLEVAQQPIHGRRKTEKDRRPLAHVPILRFRAKECWPNRYRPEWDEEELDVSGIDPTLLVCSSSIEPPNPPPSIIRPKTVAPEYGKAESATARLEESRPPLPPLADSLGPRRASGSPSMPLDSPGGPSTPLEVGSMIDGRRLPLPNRLAEPHQAAIPGPGPSSLRHRASWTADSDYNRGTQMLHFDRSAGPSRSFPPDWAPNRKDAPRRRPRQHAGESSSDESDGRVPSSKKIKPGSPTRNLYGNLHVSAVRVSAITGGLGLWFLFTDLCVRHEGTYSLHFKCFDLSALPGLGSSPVPPLAECSSQDFRVYSPRNFPGLPKQTELSEHFSRQGFKLNTRKNERHAPSPEPPPSTSAPTAGRPRPSFASQYSAPQNLQRPAPQPLQQHPGTGTGSSTEQSTASSSSSRSRVQYNSSSSVTGTTRTSGSSGGSHMSSGGTGAGAGGSILSAREAKFKSDKLDLTEELEEEEEREMATEEDKGRLVYRQSSVRDAG